MATDELLVPLLRLALVPHTLNYIAFRTILLFTFTTKSITSLARLGIVSIVMRILRRPQEVQCVRYSLSTLHRVCTSRQCRTIEVLSHFGNEDAVTLWKLVGRNDLSFARRQVLQIIASLLLAHKCRQALLRSGSMYAVLDLLGQRKRGAGFFTHAELATLNMLKVSRG